MALNASATPTAAFVKNPAWMNPAQACVDTLVDSLGAGAVGAFDADTVATRLLGDSLYTNPLMLGYAWQKGWIPLGHDALMRAIELNAVAIDQNKAAFEWGRRAAHDPKAMATLLSPVGENVVRFVKRETVDSLVARRVDEQDKRIKIAAGDIDSDTIAMQASAANLKREAAEPKAI